MLTFLSLLLFVAAAPNAVHADDEIPPRWRRHIVIAGTLLGPTGAIGAELEYSPIPQLGVNVGAGVGSLIPKDGPEFGFMVRPRYVLPGAGFALGVGAGLSFGRYTDREGGRRSFFGYDDPAWRQEWAIRAFANFEAAIEFRSTVGVYFRVGGGFQTNVEPLSAEPVCEVYRGDGCAAGQIILPYAQIALGAAFR
ncbi:MAG: hypothetical protein IPK60_07310 [Sandaracinaceae bacterium]|nr:hypothetical protein [Sandaracinaceae bacterium]